MDIFKQWGWSWTSWQKGERGEYWFLAQAISLITFVLLPIHPIVERTLLNPLLRGGLVVFVGFLGTVALVLIGKGLLDLGQSLTPLPYPREDGELVTNGVYSLVRHPLYAGIIMATLGWAMLTLSWPHCIGVLAIAFLLNQKASLEERWLEQKYPDYSEYRQRVKKIIPWIY